ncbi:hypothetical protein KP509_07G032900 [Ceratopteris richardii]|uniref:BHLH domain-containing protein n=1 Tax=Ceratopteris richardii TaxID=49495 RepID=A0A8T2UFM8_CERRI|nr:hypothetical protein KP509_07G032900 [Ceratopteris richardii]KAH7432666.1 hypothetical protein KP509_07G032900 [Ceratopteris richardii]
MEAEATAGGSGEEEMAMVGCKGSGCSNKRLRHINNERQRRVLMNNLLDSLQSLLPDHHPRKDRCTLLTDVIAHVQSLEGEIQELQARTAQMKKMKMTVHSPPSATNSATLPAALPEGPAIFSTVRSMHVELMKRNEEDSPADPSNDDDAEEAIITFATFSARGLLPHIFNFLQQNHIDVLSATISATPDMQLLYYIHAKIPKGKFSENEIESMLSNMKIAMDTDGRVSSAL